MIHDVDESLRALVKRDALNGSKVEIAFDAPTKDWVAKRNAPMVDLYLYDIREDTTRRETAWIEIRDEKGIVTERRLPPRRFRLSYLVTAWTNRPEDEHRLLSALLSCFIRHEFMPPELMTGVLENSTLPVLINVALPVPADRNIADVWSAMGGELKPSLDLIVTAPLDIERSLAAGPPVQEVPYLEVVTAENGSRRSGNGAKRHIRTLATPDVDFAATSAEAARAAEAAAAAKAGRGIARLEGTTDAASADEESSGLPDETFYGSVPGRPGRRIRVRAIPRQRPR